MEPAIKKISKKLVQTLEQPSFFEVYLVNRSFMNKNVLALEAPRNFPQPDIYGRFLGEIYLNLDYITKHRENIFPMLIHGFVHLLGYDHVKKNDRIRMKKKEKWLLKLLGN